MEEFLRVNLGNVLTILTFIVGGVMFANTVRVKVDNLGERFDGIQEEVSELKAVLVNIARQEERITAMDQRMMLQGNRIDSVADKVNHILLESYAESHSKKDK